MLIRECFQMFCLATADYRRERLLSLCSILGLAAVLAPLLVLYGVKFGVVTTMVSRMRSDPLTPRTSSPHYGRNPASPSSFPGRVPSQPPCSSRTRTETARAAPLSAPWSLRPQTIPSSRVMGARLRPLPSRKESRPPLTAEQNPPRMEKPGAPSWKSLGPFSFRKPMLSRRKRRRKPRRRRRSPRPRNTLLSGTPVRRSMKRPPEQRPEAHA